MKNIIVRLHRLAVKTLCSQRGDVLQVGIVVGSLVILFLAALAIIKPEFTGWAQNVANALKGSS